VLVLEADKGLKAPKLIAIAVSILTLDIAQAGIENNSAIVPTPALAFIDK